MRPPRTCTAFALIVALVLALAPLASAEEPASPPAAPSITLAAVEVEPANPTAETLCKLRVKLKNGGSQSAASLRFRVSVNGHLLPVYGNQLFMQELPPGTTTEVKLYNFWVSETGRPAPTDGKLKVEVSLTEAKWTKIETDAEGVEVWQPLEAVPGLPASATATLSLKVPAAPAKP